MKRSVPFLGLAVLLAWPVTAGAHLVTTGLGPFYDGVSHLFLSPDDLLGVLAMALLAGMGGARTGRLVLFLLPLAWFTGGLAGILAPTEASMPLANTISMLVLGVLVAADRKLPTVLLVGIAVGFGVLHGVLNGTAMSQAGPGALGLAGVSVVVFVLSALASALVVSRRAPWARIAVRVAGSWIAAIGLLMLGWTLRGGA